MFSETAPLAYLGDPSTKDLYKITCESVTSGKKKSSENLMLTLKFYYKNVSIYFFLK